VIHYPFAATNEPETCKWCGRKLRWKTHSVDVPDMSQEKTPTFCPSVMNPEAWKVGKGGPMAAEVCGSEILTPDGDGWLCEHGHRIHAYRKRVGRKRFYKKAGDYGDGHFCGLRCGYMFGVRLADLGSNLVLKKEKKAL
jgi:hypothetical protein